MAERTIALVLKTSGPHGSRGSNPPPSATHNRQLVDVLTSAAGLCSDQNRLSLRRGLSCVVGPLVLGGRKTRVALDVDLRDEPVKP